MEVVQTSQGYLDASIDMIVHIYMHTVFSSLEHKWSEN